MISGIGVLTGVTFASGFLTGMKNTQAAKQKWQLYLQNAQTYQKNAADIRLSGSLSEDAARAQQRAYMARGAAAAGEAGMGESPTTAAAMATSYAALEQNILNARREVESEAENYLYQARLAVENARQTRKLSKHKFARSLVSGVSSLSNISAYF